MENKKHCIQIVDCIKQLCSIPFTQADDRAVVDILGQQRHRFPAARVAEPPDICRIFETIS